MDNFWKSRRVFVTGHTGFKGSWLCILLRQLGAEVTGYSLPPPTDPNLHDLAKIASGIHSIIAEIRDYDRLVHELAEARPEVVFHLAAQPIVLESYSEPVETYSINVMGTVHLLDAVRRTGGVRAVVNVTTDKVYENRDWLWGYREIERLGGRDPYSNSKACSELITAAFRDSFFDPASWGSHGTAVATARAGNIIGGGDWGDDRLVPDGIRALLAGKPVGVRNPAHIRPWQHVLDCLHGYLLLAQALATEGPSFGGGWNFGPLAEDSRTVEQVVRALCERWSENATYVITPKEQPHEAQHLKLDASRARKLLKWSPVWNIDEAVTRVVDWHRSVRDGADPAAMCHLQIADHRGALAAIAENQ